MLYLYLGCFSSHPIYLYLHYLSKIILSKLTICMNKYLIIYVRNSCLWLWQWVCVWRRCRGWAGCGLACPSCRPAAAPSQGRERGRRRVRHQPPPPTTTRGRKLLASCCCCSRTSSASAALLGATVTLLSQLQQYHTTQPRHSHRTTSNWKSLSIRAIWRIWNRYNMIIRYLFYDYQLLSSPFFAFYSGKLNKGIVLY